MTPDTHTISETFLEVGEGHSLYLQEWGNPAAESIIINLHGGPGNGTSDRHKTVYDPKLHRVIFFDQRGAGKSLPHGELKHNTTDDLIGDITKIADHFKIDSFFLAGNSWGSCLALSYALKHAERLSGLILSSIFTGSKAEIAWIEQGMFRIFFPDVWQRYIDNTPAANRDDPAAYHIKQILGEDADSAKRSAAVYGGVQAALLRLDDRPSSFDFETFDPIPVQIEAHYMKHGCFMPEKYILDNARKVTLPTWIVHGRYDMVCPPKTAYELAEAIPSARLIWTTSGHNWERESWNVVRTILASLPG